MRRFEELLDAFEKNIPALSRGTPQSMLRAAIRRTAARSALVEYVRERMDAERQAVAAMLYLGGKLSVPGKLSPDWITEAIEATKVLVATRCGVPND